MCFEHKKKNKISNLILKKIIFFIINKTEIWFSSICKTYFFFFTIYLPLHHSSCEHDSNFPQQSQLESSSQTNLFYTTRPAFYLF